MTHEAVSIDDYPVVVSPATTVRVPGHIVFRPFAAETVILDLRTGHYHGMNPTGGRMLAALDSVGAVATAAEQLSREFRQPLDRVQKDLCRLCDELVARGVLEIVGEAA
jgi:hypothetical protein